MSKHWRPGGKIVRLRPVGRRKWTRVDAYGFKPRSRRSDDLGRLLLISLLFALARDVGPDWSPVPVVEAGRSQDIEWDKVQKVPRRVPDPADVAWERRAQEREPGLPRASGARNDVYVIDGDTFEIGGQRIRVAGIDAPELHPPRCMQEAQLGLAAKERLSALLSSGTLWISGTVADRYGRSVRTVRVNGQDVAEIMIGAGLARNYDGKQRQGWCG